MKTIITSLFFLTVLVSCKESKEVKNLAPEMAGCDSAAVMYYKQPGDPRFFTVVKLYDKASLALIAGDVNGRVISAKDTCTSEGKIYYYGKGDAVFVAYFSRNPDCLSFSYIKTGKKYFMRMSETAMKLLDNKQKEAKEPVAAQPGH